MIFDKEILRTALENIGTNYRKVLLVNLTKDNFSPVVITDDEWNAYKQVNSNSISDYWQWFCNSDFIHEEDKENCLSYNMLTNSHIVYRRKINNEWHWVLLEIIPDKDYSEDNKSCVLYVRDINNIYTPAYESVVEKIGTTDLLTKLLNKTAFQRDKERNKNNSVGILFADLNGLKWTNDNLGHAAGDELILKFAGLLSVNFGNFKCYHLSGDEFVVCCFNGDLHGFIKTAIAFHKSIWLENGYPIASVGYSVGNAGEFQKAYDEAEKEMYDDKKIFYQKFPKYSRCNEVSQSNDCTHSKPPYEYYDETQNIFARFGDYIIRRPTYIDGRIDNDNYSIEKREKCEPIEVTDWISGKKKIMTEYNFVIAKLIWNEKEQEFIFESVGERYLRERADGLEEFILDFIRRKAHREE